MASRSSADAIEDSADAFHDHLKAQLLLKTRYCGMAVLPFPSRNAPEI